VRLVAQMQGGGQERGLRSGTLPAPLLVGFGLAAGLAGQEMAAESARLMVLRQRLLEALRAQLQEVRVNGALEPRLPGNLNLCLPGVDAEALMAALPGLCLSTGSACTSASVEPSYVLQALGMAQAHARASFRVGIGRFTTAAEIDEAAGMIAAAVRGLRSP
jgi:cysteine desulfurase